MYFYIEDFVLINFAADFIVLRPVCDKNVIGHKLFRNLSVCMVETAVNFIVFVNGSLYLSFFFKIFTLLISSLFVTKPCRLKNFLKNVFLIYIYTFVLAGSVLFIKYLFVSELFGYSTVPLTLSELICGFLFGALLIWLLDCFVFNRTMQVRRLYESEVIFNGKSFDNIFLFSDTGNLLQTLNGESIVILNAQIIGRMSGIDKTVFETYDDYLEYYEKLEYDIFKKAGIAKVNTVSGSKYLMTLKTEKIIFAKKYIIDNVTVAGADFVHSEFDGIFNPIIMQNGGIL